MATDLYSMKLTPAQVAAYLVMIFLCVFPPAMLLMSGVGFGPSPVLTIFVVSAVGGTLTALLMNWPRNKALAAVSGFIGGAGAQLALFSCIAWLGGGCVPKVVFIVSMALGAVPGYLLFRWLTRSSRSTTIRAG